MVGRKYSNNIDRINITSDLPIFQILAIELYFNVDINLPAYDWRTFHI